MKELETIITVKTGNEEIDYLVTKIVSVPTGGFSPYHLKIRELKNPKSENTDIYLTPIEVEKMKIGKVIEYSIGVFISIEKKLPKKKNDKFVINSQKRGMLVNSISKVLDITTYEAMIVFGAMEKKLNIELNKLTKK